MLTVLIQFLSNQSPYAVMDGCPSKLRNVVSGVLQMEVFRLLTLLNLSWMRRPLIEKHLPSVSSDEAQRHGINRKSRHVFRYLSLILRFC